MHRASSSSSASKAAIQGLSWITDRESYRFDNPGSQYTTNAAAAFPSLNRYRDVYPFDRNRILSKSADPEKYYVNASLIELSNKDFWIASQGPTARTIGDFWGMVVHPVTSPSHLPHEFPPCNLIVQLTNFVEAGRSKCEYYFPQSLGKSLICTSSVDGKEFLVTLEDQRIYSAPHHDSFGPVKSLVKSSNSGASYIVSKLSVRSSESQEPHIVTHMHFVGWPDFGVPSSEDEFARFVSAVAEERARSPGGPPVIHCSAGVGRTGTFLAIQSLLTQDIPPVVAEPDSTHPDPVLCAVDSLREQRPLMVQGVQQLLFIYQVLNSLKMERK